MKALTFPLVVGAGVVIDLLSKAWARSFLADGSAVEFLPVLSLRLAYNKGMSFGILGADGATGLLLLLAATALLSMAVSVMAWKASSFNERLAFSLIAAGAWANLIDRAHFGRVTDFLDLHFGSWHPFIFNLADTWISLGVCLLLAAQLLGREASASRRG
jgi:signal peptidase II